MNLGEVIQGIVTAQQRADLQHSKNDKAKQNLDLRVEFPRGVVNPRLETWKRNKGKKLTMASA